MKAGNSIFRTMYLTVVLSVFVCGVACADETGTFDVPSLVPVEGSPQTINSAGISISIEPFEFVAKENPKLACKQKPAFFVMNDQYDYVVRTAPYYLIEPKHIIFKLRISNKLGKVMRMAGSIISFQINNKTVALESSGYQELMQGMILPRQESEFILTGPKISTLKDNNTIAFMMYDVMTKTDAAGNPTERANFEWFYTYKKIPQQVNRTVTEAETTMTRSEATSRCSSFF